MLLLASRGLFIGLIAVVAIVVIACVVFSFLLYRKTASVKKTLDADVVRRELYRRETDVVIQLVKENPDESKREALLNELRRIKSAEMLVEEIVKNEKADRGIAEHHAKAPAKPGEQAKAPAKPAGAPTAPAGAPAPRPTAPAGAPAPRPAAPTGAPAPRPAAPTGAPAPRPAAPAGAPAPRPATPAGAPAPRPAAPTGAPAPKPAAPAGTDGTDKPSEE